MVFLTRHPLLRALYRTLLLTGSLLIVLYLGVLMLLNQPELQRRLVPLMEVGLSQALATEVSLEGFHMEPFDVLALEEPVIYDQNGQVLLEARTINVGMFHLSALQFLGGRKQLRQVGARKLRIEAGRLHLYRPAPGAAFNFDFLLGEQDTTPPGPRPPLQVDLEQIELRNFSFALEDTVGDTASRPPQHVNYRHLAIKDLALSGSFQLTPRMQMNIRLDSLRFRETVSGLQVDQISTNFTAYLDSTIYEEGKAQPTLSVRNTHIRLGQTDLRFTARLKDQLLKTALQSKGDFNYAARFEPSVLRFEDIERLMPKHLPLQGKVLLSGTVEGDLNKIRSDNLQLEYGQGTRLATEFSLRDFAQPEQMYMRFRFRDAKVAVRDVERLLPELDLPPRVRNLRRVQINGQFLGFIRDFVSDARLRFPFGRATTNLKLAYDTSRQRFSYSGRLNLQDFNLDTLAETNISRNLNLAAQVQGKGFAFQDMTMELAFDLSRSRFRQYTVDSAGGRLSVKDQVVEGNLDVKDPEGDFSGRVELDLGKKVPEYSAYGNVQQLALHHYNLVQDSIEFSAILNLNLAGDSLENIRGYTRLFRIKVDDLQRQQHLDVDQVQLRVDRRPGLEKSIQLQSQPADLSLSGHFTYANALQVAQNLGREAKLFFENEPAAIQQYYNTKEQIGGGLDLKFSGRIKQVNPIFTFFQLPLFVGEGATFQGSMDKHSVYSASTSFTFDTLAVAGIGIDRLSGNLQLQKSPLRNDVAGNGSVNCREVAFTDFYRLADLRIAPSLAQRKIDYDLRFTQAGAQKAFRFNGQAHFKNGGIEHRFDPDRSFLELGAKRWRFAQGNRVYYEADSLIFHNFELGDAVQRIAISAERDPQNNTRLNLQLDSLRLALLNQLTPVALPLDGRAYANVSIVDLFEQSLPVLSGRIQDFRYDEVGLGNLRLNSRWQADQKRLKLDYLTLERDKQDILNLQGYYNPNDQQNPLDFELRTQELALKLFKPFYQDYLYDVQGLFDAKLFIKGSFEEPLVRGTGVFTNASLGISFFQRKFHISDNSDFIYFRGQEKQIEFKRLVMTDRSPEADQPRRRRNLPEGLHQAALTGTINYPSFDSLNFDLHMQVPQGENFVLMETRREDNEAFYGDVVLGQSGIDITGPPEDLKIRANARTGQGTQIYIPVTDYSEEQRLDYVYFKGSEPDSLSLTKRVEFKGVNFELSVEATNDAQMTIIFDEQAGDKIQARGVGNITLDIDPNGDFSMVGNYEILEGDYLFTFRNMINKKLEIDRGSTISWDGDPYDAQLRVEALYERDVQLSTLDSTLNGVRTVQVVMNMTGSLENPKIEFSINLPNLNQDQVYQIVSRLQMINRDQQELNRQVFSLLLLGQFAPMGSFFGQGASAGVTSSVSEFLSNQLNNLIGQSLKGDNVNVQLRTARDVVRVALRLSLMNDRLTIERNGAVVTGQNNDMTLGNISIQLKILPPPGNESPGQGVLAVEVFNRENIISSNAVVSSNRGVGIFYKKEFDKLKELIRLGSLTGKKKKRQK